jgi:two-component system OmpR family response regulator
VVHSQLSDGGSMTQVDAELRRADGAPVRVLVVEDEMSLAELLTMALRTSQPS